jgi:signal transduction histidine kinase
LKKRIRYISILMIVCILGIISVQGFWLYNAWKIAYGQFGRTINGALGEATSRKGFSDIRHFLALHPSYTLPDDSVAPQPRDGEPKGGFFMRHRRPARGAAPDSARQQGRDDDQAGGDSTAGAPSLSWYFIQERVAREPYDMAALDTIYREELDERGIRSSFVLDTQHVTKAEFRDSVFRRRWRDHTRLQTRWTRVNMGNDIFVRATFQTPYRYLFGQLFWLLVASLVLLILITGCLIYMMRTILKQKRWSDIKNDFISNMTHELKTPIATVSAAIEALRHFQAMDDKTKTLSYLDISQQELKRLTDLVEKVLNISVEESEEMTLQKEAVNLVDLVEGIIVRHRIKTARDVEIDFRHDLSDAVVQADRLHFTNAVNNLVDNAIKYSRGKAVIVITLTGDEHRVLLSIRDNGVGIPPYYHELVFDKFFRVPTGDLHNVKGFGLGLSYVKKVIERHGGTIELKSEPSQGSEFIITLPR